jgi:O-antigen/teichoic acid export membrane protein
MRARVSLFLKPAIAVLDQALLSGVNFLVAFLLIKTVSQEQYGYYSIAFAISLFLISIQNAVVTTPLAVLLAAKKDEEKRRYPASLYWGQCLALVPALIIGLMITAALHIVGTSPLKVWIIGALCLGAVGILVREFLRAYYFAIESPVIVFLLDSCYVLIFLALIGGSIVLSHTSVPYVFLFMGIAGVLASVFFSRQRWKFHLADIRANYAENWKIGKWSLAGIFVTHLQSYCTLYLTGTLLGSSAAGNVAASRLPLSPLSLFQTGWGKIAIPRGSRLREDGVLRRFIREQAVFTGIIGVSIAAYVAVLLASKDFLSRILFNRGYETALDFIVFWGAITIVNFAVTNASIGLQVMKEFSVITKINSVTAIITLISNYVLIRRYGITGGLASSLLGETLLATGLWFCLIQRYRKEERRHDLLGVYRDIQETRVAGPALAQSAEPGASQIGRS